MAKTAKRKAFLLEDRFELDESFLSPPMASALRSAVLRGIDRQSGDPVVVKYWQKTGTPADSDLREIWRHEMRQNERVRAFPRADEVIVELLDVGETDDAFFVILPNNLAPLGYAARFVRSDHWLRALHGSKQRILLWQNLRRLAEALGAVHGQGLVHGRIDSDAIYTAAPGTEADFKLGGFEFSLRMAELGKAPLAAIGRSGTPAIIFSFLADWMALGRTFADLIGIDPAQIDGEAPTFGGSRMSIDLRPAEIDLCRTLLKPERNRALDAQTVTARVDQVVAELESEALSNNGRYLLALHLGPNSKLSAALNAASGDTFDADERDLQTEFVEADLESGTIVARAAWGGIFLLTESLAYELKPFRSAGSDETWHCAVCTGARPRDEVRLGRREEVELPAHLIETAPLTRASRRLVELRADALDWTSLLEAADAEDPTLGVRRGLLLVQVCEALYRAAEIIPVEATRQWSREGKIYVDLVPGVSESRARLTEALGVNDPHVLMRRLFEKEEADVDTDWQLTENAGLGQPGKGASSVRFASTRPAGNRKAYQFEIVDGIVPTGTELFLRQAGDAGTEQVLRRRLRMLSALATQAELAGMLSDPRSRIRSYRGEPLVEDAHFDELDHSKREALRSIWTTGPGQFVVGPPGVGKTKLVTEIVRRALASDETVRLLVSAQAHQALDHLASEVQKKLKTAGLEKNSILVRSRADRGAHLAGAQTPDRARSFLDALVKSPLVTSAPADIRSALKEMNAAAGVRGDLRKKLSPSALLERRSFEALVLQSANVLFSTTNSGDLERLIEDGAQFDWTIVEEAAKATGPELLAPQLLSMRRLLIGDHNQLPPFETDRIGALLDDQSRVKAALAESDQAVGSIFREFGLDDLREAVEDDALLSETCVTARRMLLLFESLVTGELERQKRSDRARRQTAIELLHQHRMHPVIGDVISEVFYKKRLETPPERARAFETGPCPIAITDRRLPASPIVFVDLPYVQKVAGAAEQLPTYHNPAELAAVLSVLDMVRGVPNAKGECPTLAVLSPYNRQVERLGRAIDDRHAAELSRVNGFATAENATGFENTVDSFQGSEADLVVISLVRNNDHVGRAALGILKDRRRMNVLLSRAKWKLVIVGSLDFLRVQGRRYSRHRRGAPDAPLHLAKLLEVFDRISTEKMADGKTMKMTVVPAAKLVTGAS